MFIMDDLETFKCVGCSNSWKNIPGPSNTCSECGSLYCVWIAYDKWKEKHGLYPYGGK